MKKIIVALALVVGVLGASGVVCDAKNITYKCEFKNNNGGDTLSITFIEDDVAKKSYMTGNAGTEEVFPVATPIQKAFIEVTSAGNITVTTIFTSKKIFGEAVHSRHMDVVGNASSQYFGTCKVMP